MAPVSLLETKLSRAITQILIVCVITDVAGIRVLKSCCSKQSQYKCILFTTHHLFSSILGYVQQSDPRFNQIPASPPIFISKHRLVLFMKHLQLLVGNKIIRNAADEGWREPVGLLLFPFCPIFRHIRFDLVPDGFGKTLRRANEMFKC